ncbi:MAG: hypothetical protein GX800_04290 [Clostridiaceae bacterium]|nr:hypothetical protein [Clostridiaceae bacterium]
MIYIVTGHYGSGKTEVSINLALSRRVSTVIDLDIVNPYFRTADAKEKLSSSGIELIAPQYANTNVDMPTVPSEVYSVFNGHGDVVIDVGGDDAGAVALGQYNKYIKQNRYEMYFVINACRPMTATAELTVGLLKDIEAASRLGVTKLINNTNIKGETTVDMIISGQSMVDEVSQITGIPAWAVSGQKELLDKINTDLLKIPLELHLRLPWERGV